MYYLDLFSLYKHTTRDDRRAIRHQLNRNEVMEHKLKLQHGLCFWCGAAVSMSSHLDHIIPVYHGGSNRTRNLVASCRSCNITKATGQIEITNPYTIKDYLMLTRAHEKYQRKLAKAGLKYSRYVPKKVQLYRVYRADLFKKI